VVSHDARVADYADRVLGIEDGKLRDGWLSEQPGLAARLVDPTLRHGRSAEREGEASGDGAEGPTNGS
jgi:hypothetical protein